MVSTLQRNGTGARAFPREPLLLAPVTWPFTGEGYDGITFYYSVPAVRALLDDGGAGYKALLEDYTGPEQVALDQFETDKAAILADPDLSEDDKAARIAAAQRTTQRVVDAGAIPWAHAIIARAIYRVTWPFTDPPPDPTHPASFDCWDPQAVVWLAQAGLMEAGAGFLGPLSIRPTPRGS